MADLAVMSLEKRCKVAGLSPQRADIIVAGLAIIERIMRYLRVNVVQVHTRGVRDGLLLTMVQQAAPPSRIGRGAPGGRRGVRQEWRRRSAARPAGGAHRRLAVGTTGRAARAGAGRSRADRVGRAGGQRRLSHQFRRPPQAQLSFDSQQRAAGFRAAAAAAAGERGPLPPRLAAQAEAREFPRAVGGRSATRGGTGGHFAAGPVQGGSIKAGHEAKEEALEDDELEQEQIVKQKRG